MPEQQRTGPMTGSEVEQLIAQQALAVGQQAVGESAQGDRNSDTNKLRRLVAALSGLGENQDFPILTEHYPVVPESMTIIGPTETLRETLKRLTAELSGSGSARPEVNVQGAGPTDTTLELLKQRAMAFGAEEGDIEGLYGLMGGGALAAIIASAIPNKARLAVEKAGGPTTYVKLISDKIKDGVEDTTKTITNLAEVAMDGINAVENQLRDAGAAIASLGVFLENKVDPTGAIKNTPADGRRTKVATAVAVATTDQTGAIIASNLPQGSPLVQADIAALQQAINLLRFTATRVDGQWGPKTHIAVNETLKGLYGYESEDPLIITGQEFNYVVARGVKIAKPAATKHLYYPEPGKAPGDGLVGVKAADVQLGGAKNNSGVMVPVFERARQTANENNYQYPGLPVAPSQLKKEKGDLSQTGALLGPGVIRGTSDMNAKTKASILKYVLAGFDAAGGVGVYRGLAPALAISTMEYESFYPREGMKASAKRRFATPYEAVNDTVYAEASKQAKGAYQFMPGTWNALLRIYSKQIAAAGLPSISLEEAIAPGRTNPALQDFMMGLSIGELSRLLPPLIPKWDKVIKDTYKYTIPIAAWPVVAFHIAHMAGLKDKKGVPAPLRSDIGAKENTFSRALKRTAATAKRMGIV